MSDSEEEAAFASADEGEAATKKPAAESQASQAVAGQKEKEGVGGEGGKSAGVAAAAGDKGDQRKGKGQQQNKKKGKKGNQAAQKDNAPKSSTKSSPPSSAGGKEEKKEPAKGKNPAASDQPVTKDSKEASGKKDESTKPTMAPTKTPAPATTTTESKKDSAIKSKGDKVTKDKQGDTVTKDKQGSPLKSESSAKPESTGGRAEPVVKEKSGQEPKVEEQGGTKQAGDVRRGLQSDVSDPGSQDIPRGERDHTTQQEEILTKLGESGQQSSGGGWGWSSWGSSILSAASNSVQTFTHQVGDGFSTIMETVESSLGVPDPGEMVKAQNVTEPTPTSEEAPALTSQPDDETKKETRPPAKTEEAKKGPEQKDEKKEENKEGKEEKKEEKKEEGGAGGGNSWFASWGVSDLAKKVQDTGKSLASKGQNLMSEGFDAVEHFAAGGIDVLENIGKKTYNTLSEHDPAFRKTREFLSPKGSKPNLSSVLREARDQAEKEAEQERENEEARKAHFGTLFDDYQGIAHLEALEMLSNQSEKKVHSLLNSLSSEDLSNIKPVLISIKEAFEVNEDDDGDDTTKEQDFTSLVAQHLSELQLGTAPNKLNKVHEMVKQWIVDFDSHHTHESDSIKEVHQKSIQALAELTAKGVEQFHKAGELVLLEKDKDKDCTERAHSLARLTGVLCHEIGNLSTKFAACLNKMADEKESADEVTPLVTNVYLEATNSSTYIQDAFQLLLPVLQHAALEHSIMSRLS